MFKYLKMSVCLKIYWIRARQNLQNGMCQQRLISLGTHPVRSESSPSARRTLGSLATHWKLGSLVIHWARSEDSDHTGRTCHFVVFSCAGSTGFSFVCFSARRRAIWSTVYWVSKISDCWWEHTSQIFVFFWWNRKRYGIFLLKTCVAGRYS